MSKKLFRIHSWLAVITFFPIVIIALTGSLLVFKAELDRLILDEKVTLGDDLPASRKPMNVLMKVVNDHAPHYEIGTWEYFDDRTQSDIVYLIKKGTNEWYKAYLDPYHGVLLSTPVPLNHYLTDFLLELHYTLLMGPIGLLLAFFIALAMIALSITGILLYRKFWKRLFMLRWNKRMIIFMSDFHKMAGIFSSIVLLILGVTGAYFNIAEYIHETFQHSEEQESFKMTTRRYNDSLSIDKLIAQTRNQIDTWSPAYFAFAYEPGVNLTLYGRVETGNPLYSDYTSGAHYNPQTGDIISSWDIREQGFIAKLLDSFRRLHFGTFGGLVSRIIWCFLGAMPIILTITGICMWLKRRKVKSSKSKSVSDFEKAQGSVCAVAIAE